MRRTVWAIVLASSLAAAVACSLPVPLSVAAERTTSDIPPASKEAPAGPVRGTRGGSEASGRDPAGFSLDPVCVGSDPTAQSGLAVSQP